MNITLIVIVVTVVISLLALNNGELFAKLKFNAYDAKHSNHWFGNNVYTKCKFCKYYWWRYCWG